MPAPRPVHPVVVAAVQLLARVVLREVARRGAVAVSSPTCPNWSWPSPDEYTLAHQCTTCRAAPSEPCMAPRVQRNRSRSNIKRKAEDLEPDDSPIFHARRRTMGRRHYIWDIEHAPWPDDREPGRCYCTISPCPLSR